MDPRSIRLTETVKKGGCAAKLPAGTLRTFLGGLTMQRPPELSVGTEALDDACLWDLGNGDYLVQTVDFFTPIVNDARDFGAIAAANALSDVYAMGGEPRLALSVLAFPGATLPPELLTPLFEGALEKIHEAGACLAGGHTIDDETLKLGFCVTGFVARAQAWKNSGARPGDALILTKGLGTGTLTSALKSGVLQDSDLAEAIASMSQLNRVRDLLGDLPVHAATDITGFGLAGHALQMAEASGARFQIATDALPTLGRARECLEREILNRAHKTNADYTQTRVAWEHLTPAERWLTLDPQTSGGLLLAVPSAHAETCVERLRSRFAACAIVGRVESPTGPAPQLVFTKERS